MKNCRVLRRAWLEVLVRVLARYIDITRTVKKTTIGLISKKATLYEQHTFFVDFFAVVLHDFNVKLLETSWLFILWRKCRKCSFSLFFFSLSLIFILVAASISHFLTAATKFHVVPPTKSVFFVFFSLALALFFVELRWPVALLSLSLYSKFVDTTIILI